MPNNTSQTLYVDLSQLALETIGAGLSPPVTLEVNLNPVDTLSPPFYINAITYLTAAFVNFSTYIGDILVTPNIIQIAESGAINVSTLILSDKTGSGNCVIVPPSGAAYQFKGMRIGFENLTADYTVPQHKSGYIWTNTAAANIIATLPSGAFVGTTAVFSRTGGIISIKPNPNARIWASSSGNFRPAGQSIILGASGTKVGLICDGSEGWYPTIEEGTIT